MYYASNRRKRRVTYSWSVISAQGFGKQWQWLWEIRFTTASSKGRVLLTSSWTSMDWLGEPHFGDFFGRLLQLWYDTHMEGGEIKPCLDDQNPKSNFCEGKLHKLWHSRSFWRMTRRWPVRWEKLVDNRRDQAEAQSLPNLQFQRALAYKCTFKSQTAVTVVQHRMAAAPPTSLAAYLTLLPNFIPPSSPFVVCALLSRDLFGCWRRIWVIG